MVLNIVSSRPRVAWYAIARQYAVHNTHDEVAALLVDENSNWLKRNPVTAAKHFNTDSMFFCKSFCNQLLTPLGEIADYAIRIQLQAKGSLHSEEGNIERPSSYSTFKSKNIPHIAGEIKHVDSDLLSLPVPKPSLQTMILSMATITKNWLCLV